MGPIMMDVLGTSLTEQDKELVQHPLVGGLILFSRNFDSIPQIQQLISDIRANAKQPLLIAVDHEGGRVQRFREGFSQIPAMGALTSLANNDVKLAKQYAWNAGALMALEVRAIGIDISFAPVLDINDISEVIGLRAFGDEPEIIITLATAFIEGMAHVDMKATGKHFPGHGSVQADSHVDLPVDGRSFEEITNKDIIPFKQLISANKLDAIMPAHVIYPAVDNKSVGFSRIWLQDILRKQLGFNGTIFSDDLSMEAASSIGGYIERAEAAQEAGCDMLLVCNNRDALINVIDNANIELTGDSSHRIANMLMKKPLTWSQMKGLTLWQELSDKNIKIQK
ncbi:beta-N-acetylhexosaminidase [Thalassotalea marina]|uniref:Beta-hexosaminidase n=1 Tax=Thalassotalea marina TaxID=1673741 RepID=A0A919EM28_9GAMM|nr:beta-hexosaminidase [Thalassotalea marina]